MAKLRRLRLNYTDYAILHIRQIGASIGERNVPAARRVLAAIRRSVERLTEFPEIGRIIPETLGAREWIASSFPYLLVYRVDRDCREVTVLAVYHAAQDRRRH